LSYACQLWGQYDSKFSHRVLVLQKYALRLISFSNPRSPSSPLFARLKILQIFDLVKVLNVLFVHQFLNAKLPTDLRNTFSFTKIDHFYSTRSKALGMLKLPKVNTKFYGTNSLCMQSISQWNFFQQLIPKVQLSNLTKSQLKSLITSYVICSYWLNHRILWWSIFQLLVIFPCTFLYLYIYIIVIICYFFVIVVLDYFQVAISG
jgi:hypothetical protein